MSATAIILLALWGGGVGCLWCCVSDLSKACCDERAAATVQDMAGSCPSHHRCCESAENDQRAAIKQASSSAAAHCCPIGAHSSGPAAFPSSQNRQALAVTPIEPSTPVALLAHAPPLIPDAPPTNKGSTYLRCCVFLI